MSGRKKSYLEIDVYAKALERIEYLYRCYTDLVVSFSGGKDSTAVLLCTIDVARKLGRLPVKVWFFDEEAVHPPTVEYVQRVAAMPEVELSWFCLPVQHRNACSNEQPFWHPWHPEEKHLWVREMPEQAITEHPAFKWGMTIPDVADAMSKNTNLCLLTGIRTQESLRRHMAVTNKHEENYVTKKNGVYLAHPIYDWQSTDVWKLVALKNADYNKTYDIFNSTKFFDSALVKQRVCPPYGEEPLRGLHMYAECFPELWHKMIFRVKGAATAARYANSELYSRAEKPEGITWRQHVENVLLTYDPVNRNKVITQINYLIEYHKSCTDEPIPDEPHLVTGVGWSSIAQCATRGDFKGRQIQRTLELRIKAQAKANISGVEAYLQHGKAEQYESKLDKVGKAKHYAKEKRKGKK